MESIITKADDAGLRLLGIDPSVPPGINPPRCLSISVAQHWRATLSDNEYRASLPLYGNITDMWLHTLGMMRDWADSHAAPYLSFEYAGRSMQNEVIRNLSRRRAKLAQVVDRSMIFTKVDILYHYSGVEFLETPQHPTFRIWTAARLRTPIGTKSRDFFEWLTEKSSFNQHASKWVYSGALEGSEVSIIKYGSSSGIMFEYQVEGGRVHVPEDLTTDMNPATTLDACEEYVLQDLWAPLVRRFRLRTIRNINQQQF